MEEHPRRTYAAEVLEAHKGLGLNALACVRGAVVVVQGDRDSPPDSRWCCCNGRTGLVPLSLLKTVATDSFAARALFEFTAGDPVELTVTRGELVTVTPKRDDPSGWCTAASSSSGKKRTGLVPQNYVMPVLSGRSSTGGGSSRSFSDDSGAAHAAWAQSAVALHSASNRAASVDYTHSRGGGGRNEEYGRRWNVEVAPTPAAVTRTERDLGLGNGSEQWSGYAGAVTPPAGFFPAKAMAEIWDLGLAIARAPAAADAGKLFDVERRIEMLNAQLKGWALAEEQKSHAARQAARGAGIAVGLGTGSRAVQSSAPEQRADRLFTRAALPAEQQQSRLVRYDEDSADNTFVADGQVPRHGPGWPKDAQGGPAGPLSVQPDARPTPSTVSRVFSFGRRSGSKSSSNSARRHSVPAPELPAPAASTAGAKKSLGVLGKVQRSMSFGASRRRASAGAPAAQTSAAGAASFDQRAREEAARADMHRSRSFDRQSHDRQLAGYGQQAGYARPAGQAAPQGGHAQQPGYAPQGSYPRPVSGPSAQQWPPPTGGYAPGLSGSSWQRPSPASTMGSTGMQTSQKAGGGYSDHNGQYSRDATHYAQPQQQRKLDPREHSYAVQAGHGGAGQGTSGLQQELQWPPQSLKPPW